MVYSVVIKNTKGAPIGGALLTFYSAAGTVLGTIRTGVTGTVAVDDQAHPELAADGVTFSVSAGGYKTDAGWMVSDFDPTLINRITMVENSSTAAVVGIGAALLLVGGSLLGGKKKKKVSGFGFFDSLTNWQKIGLAAGAGLGIYYIFFHSAGVSNTDLANTAGADLATLHNQGIDPTISATQADTYAGELVAAFEGCGTDEQAVYNVFSNLRNKADVLLLISVFGVRSYAGCFDGPIWKENVDYNLGQAISSELSAGEISHLNGILAGNGIQYSF
jgi:LPXTG-motif cell wall-anchored protein